MDRGRVGEDRGSKETDGCPLTLTEGLLMLQFCLVAHITGLNIDANVVGHLGPPIIAGYDL
jgi:hypothetical protein